MFYRIRETIMNRGRRLYDKNLKFLDKLLTPLYFSLSYSAGKILLGINLNEFGRVGKNLMEVKMKSIV